MSQFSTPSSRWAALQTRNPAAANAFVYCVTTTKIYCRPTCPSRLARRANVVFHDTAIEAQAANFRACKRCRPETAGGDEDPQKIFVDKACELIRKEVPGGEKWGVKALAKEVGLTESHFCRVFKKVLGITIGEYRNLVHPKAPEIASKEVSMSPVGVQHSMPEIDILPDCVDTAIWNLANDQLLMTLDENWTPQTENGDLLLESFPLSKGFLDNQTLDLDGAAMELSKIPYLDGLSDEQILDAWIDENHFINYS